MDYFATTKIYNQANYVVTWKIAPEIMLLEVTRRHTCIHASGFNYFNLHFQNEETKGKQEGRQKQLFRQRHCGGFVSFKIYFTVLSFVLLKKKQGGAMKNSTGFEHFRGWKNNSLLG